MGCILIWIFLLATSDGLEHDIYLGVGIFILVLIMIGLVLCRKEEEQMQRIQDEWIETKRQRIVSEYNAYKAAERRQNYRQRQINSGRYD